MRGLRHTTDDWQTRGLVLLHSRSVRALTGEWPDRHYQMYYMYLSAML